MSELTLDDWMQSALDALEQTAVALLAFPGFEAVERRGDYPADGNRFGAFIPMVCDTETVQVALVSDKPGCTRLAAAMLYEEPDDIDRQDVADAMGEILNVAAGLMESEISERDSSVDLGLPVVLDGYLVPTHEMEIAVSSVVLDDVSAELVVLRRARELSGVS